MGLYIGIFTALLVIGLSLYLHRNWQAKRILKIIPRWVVRKYGDGTKAVFFCVEIWNRNIAPITVTSVTFSTSKHAEESFEIKNTLCDQPLPIAVGSANNLVLAYTNTDVSRIAFQYLNKISVSLNNGYKQIVSSSDIEKYLNNYQADLDRSNSCNPHHPSHSEY